VRRVRLTAAARASASASRDRFTVVTGVEANVPHLEVAAGVLVRHAGVIDPDRNGHQFDLIHLRRANVAMWLRTPTHRGSLA
jgi:hypothetical protein